MTACPMTFVLFVCPSVGAPTLTHTTRAAPPPFMSHLSTTYSGGLVLLSARLSIRPIFQVPCHSVVTAPQPAWPPPPPSRWQFEISQDQSENWTKSSIFEFVTRLIKSTYFISSTRLYFWCYISVYRVCKREIIIIIIDNDFFRLVKSVCILCTSL